MGNEGVGAMVGLVLTNIDAHVQGYEAFFYADLDGRKFKMHHRQDCCETVQLIDICGDLQDLIGTELLVAEERTQDGAEYRKANGLPELEYGCGSETWTFYEFRTVKGSVTMRWYGSSNGHYSETVEFEELTYN